LGDYRFSTADINPFAGGAQTTLTRAGTPFWDYLDERGIPVQIYKIPANYPPSESTHGHTCCLAGMGVPDALATHGTYQHFSNEPRAAGTVGGGRRDRITKDFKNGGYIATMHGPPNEYKPASRRTGQPPDLTIELRLYPDPQNPCAKITWVNAGIAANENKEIILNEGEWSDWQDVYFLKTPVGPSLPTMARFYLQQVRPNLKLLVSPLNFIPTNCAATISEPPEFVAEIGEGIGPFYTQGFAESYKARHNNDLSDEEYRAQADLVLDESFKMLDYALERYVDGVLFFYFSSTDLQAHIFWWDSDRPHPFRSPEDAKKYHAVIEQVYERMDEALLKCITALGDDATCIVMSDHGFGNFRRQFGLNSWLRANGYLDSQDDVFYGKTDWSKTRAYGLGINGLYLNQKGRERMGIVEPSDRFALLDEISKKLLDFEDPGEPGSHPIKRVYRGDQIYKGPEAAHAPDLVIGYEREYRASWATCTGYFDSAVMRDNKEAWSADHCVAHDLVPGILLTNRPIAAAAPSLIDVAPTILAEYGIATPESMEGQSFLK
ncbi:MAG TPA: alkaline phosphatase family protein, partial [Phycisphaerae bacterium]|nr:alkaline phosphatase family protein [Phycisphaerae bacterium]